MEHSLTLTGQQKACIRLLQLTDTHLFAREDGTLLAMNTHHSLQAVVEAVRARQCPFDLIVATGDIAQDQSADAYARFAALIAPLQTCCVWLPGNHDQQTAMHHQLSAGGLLPHKHILCGEHWQLLLLDSQVEGEAHGWLSRDQLDWLSARLSEAPQRYSLILLHHPPLSAGCSWLDQHRLQNAAELADRLAPWPRAHTLLCGHIHQALDRQWCGRRVLATPSTCIQFRPGSPTFALDAAAPGWRWLELYPDGTLQTTVERLENYPHCPDMLSEGY